MSSGEHQAAMGESVISGWCVVYPSGAAGGLWTKARAEEVMKNNGGIRLVYVSQSAPPPTLRDPTIEDAEKCARSYIAWTPENISIDINHMLAALLAIRVKVEIA